MVVEKRKPVAVLVQVLKMSAQQELLRKAWKGGRRGTLSAMSGSKAWAIRECWQAESKGDYGLNTFVAKRLQKVGLYLFYTCSQTRSCTRLCLSQTQPGWYYECSQHQQHFPREPATAHYNNCMWWCVILVLLAAFCHETRAFR